MSDESVRSGPVDLSREADFVLGGLEVSPSSREVIRGGQRESLEPKAMQVLAALHQAEGRVVSRDELIARCWDGRIVGEDAINRVIWRLRRLSEEDSGASFTIETIAKVGYRLRLAADPGPPVTVAPVEAGAAPPPPPLGPVQQSIVMRRRLAIAAVAAVIAVAAAAWLLRPGASKIPAGPGAARSNPTGVTIAVLPFLNLAQDKDQEFFSDGMTEEITSALAKVPGLVVIGRTSAFQFKGENKDMRAIGEALGAKNLIEGSVRQAGDQVRITVQLIKAADGTHLWAESYDRKLTDIFAVQEDIATAIAGALQVPLGLKRGQNLVSNRTTDTQSYEAYLRAKELVRARGFANLTGAITLLEQGIARDPNYAPTWALLASAYALLPVYASPVYVAVDVIRQTLDADLPKAEAAARKAIALDANNPEAWSALAQVVGQRKNLVQADDAYKHALRLDPKNVDARHFLAHNLLGTGRVKEALELRRQTVALDPLDARLQNNLAHVLALNGEYDSALAIKNRRLPDLAEDYAAAGRFREAADTLLKISPGFYPAGMVETAARLLRALPAQAGPPQDLPAFAAADLSWVFLYVGAPSRAMEYAEAEVKAGYVDTNFTDVLWYPAAAPLRRTERFKALMRNAGYVDYWRARGWPDLCHPVGAGDFACN